MGHISNRELLERVDDVAKRVEVGAYYRHSKSGGVVQILHLGLDEATEKPVVIYKHEEDSAEELIWVRDADVFLSKDEINGQSVPKFIKIKEK